jgi:hypothetical protein
MRKTAIEKLRLKARDLTEENSLLRASYEGARNKTAQALERLSNVEAARSGELIALQITHANELNNLREQATFKESEWLKRWSIAEREISALRTGIGRESNRNLVTPCATCGKPSGLKTNPVVQCLECFRGINHKPQVCGKECIAVGGGVFKCAKPAGHPPGCQGVTQDGLLAEENIGEAERRANPEEVKKLEEAQAKEDARGLPPLLNFIPDSRGGRD